jgi:spore coat protein CotF
MEAKYMNYMKYYENYNFDDMLQEDLVQEILRLNWFVDEMQKTIDKIEKVNDTLMKKHPAFKENINVDDIIDKLVAGDSLTKIAHTVKYLSKKPIPETFLFSILLPYFLLGL